jgi:N-methylhydantoinase A
VGFGAGVGATHVAPRKHRSVIWADGRAGDTPVYAAEDLSGAGTHVPGPAIVEAVDTTIVVPAHWHLTTDHHRQYILQAEAQS